MPEPVDDVAVRKLCDEVALARAAGHEVVIVTSGAVTAGVAVLRPAGGRPSDAITLQALSSIGQHRLMRVYDDALGAHGIAVGQVLLAPLDFGERRQYLHARRTLLRLLELGVVPVVNENDAVADDEIRFGDNDRLAALVANLLGASLLVLLTDQAGLFDADPRKSADASLVELVTALDAAVDAAAGGPGSRGGSGGMAAKIAAARMAAWSGVRVVIAKASRPDVLADAIAEHSWRRDGRAALRRGVCRRENSGSPSRCRHRARCSSTRAHVVLLSQIMRRRCLQLVWLRRRGGLPA